MPRTPSCRTVASVPDATFFKPQGIPLRLLEVVTLAVDECEALRLADLLGLYHDEAAQRMGVSRQTFGRIIESARRKVVSALVETKAIEITGGNVRVETRRGFACGVCGHNWSEPFGTGRPATCPACSGTDIRRTDAHPCAPRAAGCGRRRGPRRGGGTTK